MRRNFLLLLLAAMFTMISCEKNQQPREIDPFIQSLRGTWRTDSYIEYDKEYKEVVKVWIDSDEIFGEGISRTFYIFKEDGTLTTYASACNPSMEPFIDDYFCAYNQDSKILLLTSRTTILSYLVSSYDGEYLVLDCTLRYQYDRFTDKYYYTYVRETLKRDPNWTMPQN
ncbi:MAG: hypothetical protein J6Q01_02960 [Alistipes sp.]|nr:hypothetical protein [Alistipes sp.]